MRINRAFCLASLLLLSLSGLAAHAKTIVVDRQVPPTVSVGATSFGVDRKEGRAWVVVDFVEHGGAEEQVYSERVPVPGLTYDAATRTIHLQDDGGRDLTCAVGKQVLWATHFRPTSDCPIRVEQTAQAGLDGAAQARFVIQVGTAP